MKGKKHGKKRSREQKQFLYPYPGLLFGSLDQGHRFGPGDALSPAIKLLTSRKGYRLALDSNFK